MQNWAWEIDGWMMVTGALCAASAALLGNFIVLRRMSLIGDAISHAVLPGLAAAFLLTGQRQGVAMFVGAAIVGVLTVLLTELARRYGRVDEGAAIGVVFTGLFAVGLILINLDAAKRVDLDAGCVLYGSLEAAVLDKTELWGMTIPRGVIPLTLVLFMNLLFVVGLYRPLKVSTFDPQLAAAQGVPVAAMHYALAAIVAVTAVASFESVGNILVVAMLVVPPVTAWLLTDRLAVMIPLSVLIGVAAAILGHLAAFTVPSWLATLLTPFIWFTNVLWNRDLELPTLGKSNTAGMMTVAGGCLLMLAVFFAPGKGILSRALRSLQVALRILSEDVLAAIYRAELQGASHSDAAVICKNLQVSSLRARMVLTWLNWSKLIKIAGSRLALSEEGRRQAQNVVRSHRLWEQYLASEVGVTDSLLHEGAERFEHFTDRQLRDRLNDEMNAPDIDPHGQPIPPEAP
jgi:manganese/zinc/iron transport system permease protein